MKTSDSRDIVRRTLNFDSPARIPRQTWILPWAEKKHPGWVSRLRREYPDDIVPSPVVYKKTPSSVKSTRPACLSMSGDAALKIHRTG